MSYYLNIPWNRDYGYTFSTPSADMVWTESHSPGGLDHWSWTCNRKDCGLYLANTIINQQVNNVNEHILWHSKQKVGK